MATRRFRRAAWSLTVIPVLALVAACAAATTDDVAEHGPADAVGVVASVVKEGDTVEVGFTPDEGYEYFDGTTFSLAVTDGLEDPDGLHADPNNLAVGDHLEVWVGPCAESFPVQCSDAHARVASDDTDS
jgi:hypothetical protein